MRLPAAMCLSGVLFSGSVLGQETFQTLIKKEIGLNKELSTTCRPPVFAFKECLFNESIVKTSIDIPYKYAIGANTHIEIEKDFFSAEPAFNLHINGVAYTLNNEPSQSFSLPAGSIGNITLEITSIKQGYLVVPKRFKSMVKNIIIVMDGSNYVKLQLDSLSVLSESVNDQQKSYNLQKKFLKFFKKTDADIGEIKENLTGRKATDYSYDCLKNRDGEADVLDPDTCQQLRIFNDYLTGKDTGISEGEMNIAFEKLVVATDKLNDAITILKQAQIDYDRRYNVLLASALQLVQQK